MTYEEAVYYKYLLICGDSEELSRYIDTCLAEEASASSVILHLCLLRSCREDALAVLNEFLSKVPDGQIDYDRVFVMVLGFLQRQYWEKKAPFERITEFMYQIAVLTGKTGVNPWWTMYVMDDLYFAAEKGYITKERFETAFENFISRGICIESS